MITRRSSFTIVALVFSAVVLLQAGRVAKAEVGVVWPASSQESGMPYVFSIIDDIDPIPTGWRPILSTGGHLVPLNTSGFDNGDGPPSVLYNPVSNIPLVAWARNSATGYDVVLSIFQNGAWSEPQVLAAEPEDELDPSLFLEPDGSVHLVYWVEGTPQRVFHRQASADLSTWTDPVQVSQPGEEACRPAGVSFDGVIRVAYEVHNFGSGQTPRQIVLARREEEGFVPEVMAMTSYGGEVRPQPHALAGKFWLDWIDADGEAAWIRMNPNTGWEGKRYEPFNGTLERDFLVRRAIQLKAVQ